MRDDRTVLRGSLAGMMVLLCICPVVLGGPVINAKAERYLSVLMERPAPGYLFDQFHSAWLETASNQQLQDYLTERAKQDKSAAPEMLLALLSEYGGDYPRSLEWYDAALAKTPAAPQVLLLKASLEVRTLAYDKAIADLKAAAAGGASGQLRIDILKLLGKVYARNEQEKEALATWRLLAEAGDEGLKEDVLELQIAEGMYGPAAEACQQLIEAAKSRRIRIRSATRRRWNTSAGVL